MEPDYLATFWSPMLTTIPVIMPALLIEPRLLLERRPRNRTQRKV